MFLLAGTREPASAEELASAIREGLEAMIGDSSARPVVRGEGERADRPSLLCVSLDGVAIDPALRPRPGERRVPGPVVGDFAFGGEGIRVGRTTIDLSLRARDVRFQRAADEAGRPVLVPESAREGTAELFLPRAGLADLFREGIRATAGKQGIRVEDVDVELVPEGRAVRVRLLVTVKKVFTAKVRVAARIEPGDGPAVVLGNVSCRGEGFAGNMVAKLARPQVESLEGRELSLAAFLPPGLSPCGLELATEDGLRIRAVLGEGPDAG